jgi:hypothetical protein
MTQTRLTARGVAVFAFTVGVFVVAGLGFAYKMAEFAVTIARDEVEGFGAVAVSIYLIGMIPIVFVTLWAVVTGRFRDIERPKYRLFELDDEIERGGGMRYRVGAPAAARRP